MRNPTPSDGELDQVTLTRAQRGDERACRALVERYQRRVFALLSRFAGRQGRAVDDLAQETFLRVFRALPDFTAAGPARLSTWILTIATRLALDELRRKPARLAPLDQAAAVPAPARTDEPAERAALGRAIERAVRALSPDHQAVFLLREYHDLEYDEIARALDIDIGTVKSRLSRARTALREALAEVQP